MNERNTKDGETHWAQASGKGLQRPAPKQFSEIDESASSQSADSESMKAIGDLAYRDVTTGVDTDRGPVMDAPGGAHASAVIAADIRADIAPTAGASARRDHAR